MRSDRDRACPPSLQDLVQLAKRHELLDDERVQQLLQQAAVRDDPVFSRRAVQFLATVVIRGQAHPFEPERSKDTVIRGHTRFHRYRSQCRSFDG